MRLNGVDAEMHDLDGVKKLMPHLDFSKNTRFPVTGGLSQPRGGTARHDAVAWGYARAADARETTAGYLADLYLVGVLPAGLLWTLDVRRKAPPFVLTDRINHRKFELETADEVSARLRGGR